MKLRISVLLITVISIAVLCLIAHAFLVPQRQNDAAYSGVDNAEALYMSAASKIDLTKDATLTIHLTEEMTVDGAVFQETSYRTVCYDIQKSGTPFIMMQESRHSGTHTIEITETFANNTVFMTVNDTPFSSVCTREQYEAAQIPALLLTASLYKNINAVDTGNAYMVTFAEPIGAEDWLTDLSATLLTANGVAHIGYDGTLESSMYTASYQLGDITFRITADVGITQEDNCVTLPEDTLTYTQISDWQAPKLLEQACGYLVQTKHISSVYTDSIYFEAIGDHREKNVELHAYFDDAWSVTVTTDITTSNETRLDQTLAHKKKELFIHGQYCSSNNGEPLNANSAIDVDAVYNYFQDQLVCTIMLPQHIRSADRNNNGNSYRIIFSGTEAFGHFLAENACQLLYNDPNLITETGSEFMHTDLTCYLDIDKTTGLPVASGINFNGNYKVEGIPYSLQYRADQTYSLPDPEAKNMIEKAAD